jgi:hypothetical protein
MALARLPLSDTAGGVAGAADEAPRRAPRQPATVASSRTALSTVNA